MIAVFVPGLNQNIRSSFAFHQFSKLLHVALVVSARSDDHNVRRTPKGVADRGLNLAQNNGKHNVSDWVKLNR
jgi:hypothetical protein